MPYRFKIDESVEKGFRRIAREQLDVALQELAAPEVQPKGVHECRKALKRLRGLVRLTAPALGKDKARKRLNALSEIAQLLAGHRDQAVMLDTLAKLTAEREPDGALTLAPLNAHFAKSLGDAQQPLDPGSAAKVRLMLLREAKKFSRAGIRKRGFAALEGGLAKSYRHARKSLKIAYSEPTDETFHTLRKSVQWHWRQMSLLARAWPDEFAVRVAVARELSQILGDDHDLALLIAETVKADDISSEQKEAIVDLCLHKQQALRAAAEFRAELLFAEMPRAFMKRMEAYWKFGSAMRALEIVHRARPDEPQAVHLAALDAPVAHADVKPAVAKPRLTAKTATAAPSQRRA
ncbi:CHAD domain containing protein [Hyphomicrobium denitrificans 1NES1]|uniref:CHAD domain containing protein n=1 Tax=Hyphomicrobium denitrificans 1NES1 TaxID=670307 RepID=N0BF55_9HYPH|nr:CHAD domain-containing protein [Hyphomicrobium denitrificans]AGK59056.1 CHAD domain containing protein [Hyphomicrobium denitrificans 1NES1]